MKELFRNTWKNKGLLLMALPGIILIFMFSYMPMFGILVAFKDFNYQDGIFGSRWVGLDNFRILFVTKDVTLRLIRNTVGYWFLFMVTGTILNVSLAIALNECVLKRFSKISHTFMILPTFISWIAVTFIVKALLDGQDGMLNHIRTGLGLQPIQWYSEPGKWPVILLLTNIWKGTGYGAIIYLSAITGLDSEVFESAELDGATRWQQIRYIMLPMLVSMISIMTLLGLGGIMSSNTGLFYQVTKNIGLLYSTTQTIDAYIMNALTSGSSDFGMSSAVTFFQSVVGFVMIVVSNGIVRRWEPDNALF